MSKSPHDQAAPSDPAQNPDPHADEAKGTPHSDRHAAETLAGRLEKAGPAEQKTK